MNKTNKKNRKPLTEEQVNGLAALARRAFPDASVTMDKHEQGDGWFVTGNFETYKEALEFSAFIETLTKIVGVKLFESVGERYRREDFEFMKYHGRAYVDVFVI